MAKTGMRVIGRLKPSEVATLQHGKYSDGGGLQLVVRKNGSKYWEFRYMRNRKAESMGLGSWPDLSIAAARDEAHECRKFLRSKKDPRQARAEKLRSEVPGSTFRQDADGYFKQREGGWVPNTKEQYERTLENHVYHVKLANGLPTEATPSKQIDITAVLKILTPIWEKINPTARLARWLIEQILGYSMIVGKWKADNPARWDGNLANVLRKADDIHRTRHFSSLHYSKAPAYLADVRRADSIAASVLEFDMHVPVRISVALGAEWTEFNPVETSVGVECPDMKWSIPEGKMKGYKKIGYPDGKYEIPLSEPAVEILKRQWKIRESKHVFPGEKYGSHVNRSTVLALAQSLTSEQITTHGFRATFESWADDRAICEDMVKEMCLGHAVGKDETEKAYRRADLFGKRGLLMEAWSEYLVTGRDVAVDINERFMQRFNGGMPVEAVAPTIALSKVLSHIAIVDIEASGLTSTSYPTELGWAFFAQDGSIESGSVLIRPDFQWLSYHQLSYRRAWSSAIEHLTGITRELLDRDGVHPINAWNRFVQALRGRDLYSDEPEFDRHWLCMLTKAAGFICSEDGAFFFEKSLAQLMDEMSLTVAFSDLPHHRAEADARRLLMALHSRCK